MSQLRLGIRPDGTRDIRVLEPAAARRTGWGGAAVGHASVTFTVHQRRPVLTEAERLAHRRKGL